MPPARRRLLPAGVGAGDARTPGHVLEGDRRDVFRPAVRAGPHLQLEPVGSGVGPPRRPVSVGPVADEGPLLAGQVVAQPPVLQVAQSGRGDGRADVDRVGGVLPGHRGGDDGARASRAAELGVLGRHTRADLVEVSVDRPRARRGLDVLVTGDARQDAACRQGGAGARGNGHRPARGRVDARDGEARRDHVREGLQDERGGQVGVVVGAEDGDAEGASVARRGVRAGDDLALRRSQRARASLPASAVFVDEDVVADVPPFAGVGVVAVDAADRRGDLGLGVGVGPRRVVDDRAFEVGVAARPGHLGFVRAPGRARLDGGQPLGGRLVGSQAPRGGRSRGGRRAASRRRDLGRRRAAVLRGGLDARGPVGEDRPLLVAVGDLRGDGSGRGVDGGGLGVHCALGPLAVDHVQAQPAGELPASLDAQLHAGRGTRDIGLGPGTPLAGLVFSPQNVPAGPRAAVEGAHLHGRASRKGAPPVPGDAGDLERTGGQGLRNVEIAGDGLGARLRGGRRGRLRPGCGSGGLGGAARRARLVPRRAGRAARRSGLAAGAAGRSGRGGGQSRLPATGCQIPRTVGEG